MAENKMNDNTLSRRWKERYAGMSERTKQRLDWLNNADSSEFQLQLIKGGKKYPEIGDIFIVKPIEDVVIKGLVINNHVNSRFLGKDLITVLIFKEEVNVIEIVTKGIKKEDILIGPAIVGKEYWTRGYFYNIDSHKKVDAIDYGFFDVVNGIFVNEKQEPINREPELLGTFGVATGYGIARQIWQELIILDKI